MKYEINVIEKKNMCMTGMFFFKVMAILKCMHTSFFSAFLDSNKLFFSAYQYITYTGWQ